MPYLRSPTKTRAIAVYVITGLVFGAGGARGLAIPLYADSLGASHAVVGLLFTAFTLGGAALALPAGLIADRFGHRASVVLSVVAGGASQIVAGLTTSVPVLFGCQVVGGLAAGASQTVLMAALTGAVSMERMGRAMGWLTLAIQTGFLVGPAVAGTLLHWLDYRETILITGATPFLIALALAFAGVAAGGGDRRRRLELGRPLRALASRPGFYGLCVGLFAATMMWGTYQAYIPILGRKGFALTATEVGYLLAIQAVVNGGARIPAGMLVDRFPRKGVLVGVTVAIFCLACVLLPHLQGFWAPAVLLVATVPFLATGFVAIAMVFAQMAPADARGAAMGVYTVILYFGLGFGPAVFAPLMDRSFVTGFTAAGLVTLGLALLATAIRPEPLRRRRRATLPAPPAD